MKACRSLWVDWLAFFNAVDRTHWDTAAVGAVCEGAVEDRDLGCCGIVCDFIHVAFLFEGSDGLLHLALIGTGWFFLFPCLFSVLSLYLMMVSASINGVWIYAPSVGRWRRGVYFFIWFGLFLCLSLCCWDGLSCGGCGLSLCCGLSGVATGGLPAVGGTVPCCECVPCCKCVIASACSWF